MKTRTQRIVAVCVAIVAALFLTWDEPTLLGLVVFTTLYSTPLAWLLHEGLSSYVHKTKPEWERILIRGLVTILVWTAIAIAQQLA